MKVKGIDRKRAKCWKWKGKGQVRNAKNVTEMTGRPRSGKEMGHIDGRNNNRGHSDQMRKGLGWKRPKYFYSARQKKVYILAHAGF